MHSMDFPMVIVAIQEGSIVLVALTNEVPAVSSRARSITTGSAFGAISTLRAGARWVRTPILPMSNAQVGILWLVLDSINGLDGVRDVREVDECAVPRYIGNQ